VENRSLPEITPEISLGWRQFQQLSAKELYDVLRFRQGIFVVEQGSPYPDLDGLDQTAWHLLLAEDDALAGYLRLAPTSGPPPCVSIGRVAVAAPLRGRGLGRMLMDRALRLCRDDYPDQPLVLRAQLHLVPFYRSFGFRVTSEPFDDFGVTHVEMKLPSRRAENLVSLHKY
jgi:ElaA protein